MNAICLNLLLRAACPLVVGVLKRTGAINAAEAFALKYGPKVVREVVEIAEGVNAYPEYPENKALHGDR